MLARILNLLVSLLVNPVMVNHVVSVYISVQLYFFFVDIISAQLMSFKILEYGNVRSQRQTNRVGREIRRVIIATNYHPKKP